MGLTFCRRKPHARSFEPCFDDQLVGTFDAPRTNGPACLLVPWVLHVRCTLLQVGQVLLDCRTGIASGQPNQVFEHPLWSLMFEPVQDSLEPGGRQSPSCCLHGLPNRIDVLSGMRPRPGCARHPHGGSRPAEASTRPHLAPHTLLLPVPAPADAFRPTLLPQSWQRHSVARSTRGAVCRPPRASCA